MTTTIKKGLVSKASSLDSQILSDHLAPTLTDPRLLVDPRALKTLFFTEDWVYILCDRIASLISAQWMRVMRDQIQDGKRIPEPAEDHPVQKLLETPNSEQDYHSFMYSLIVDELIGGNAIFWRAAASDQLLLLPSESTTIDLATDGAIKAYRVIYGDSWTQKALSFDPQEICHIRRPNPSSRIWGLSPFIPGAKAVSFNRYTGEYLVNFYQKGSQPGLILELPEGAIDKQAHRLLRSIENSHTGRANQFRPMVTPKGVSVHQVAQSLADQQLIDHLNANRETILNLLQVPKHEVGLDGGRSLGGGDEYRISRANFWRGQLKSIMRRV
ncbi:MAG: phage portal protein, partial [Burkholderiaceae bacterium]